MSTFLGMRGTGDWVADARPENWRETILYLYPNGAAPLTAILSMIGSEATDDPHFNWWTKDLADQGGDVSNVYVDAALSTTAGTAAYAADTTLYFKVAEAVAEEFREGHQAMAQKGSDSNYSYVGSVKDVVKNGADSYIAVKLLEAVDASYPINSTDEIDVIGNSNPEGATMPTSIKYNPVKHFNYTQIFRTPLQITDTARQTRLRTKAAYEEARREALEYHAIEMEKAFIFSVRTLNTGANGKPERTTYGLRNFILDNTTNTGLNYPTTPGYGGVSWASSSGGVKWLDEQLERVFRKGNNEKLGLVGNLALLGIQRLAKADADMNITPKTTAYGLKVLEWMTPFGTIYLKTHPLFNHRPAFRRDLMIIEPQKMRYRYVRNRDTRFITDPRDNRNTNNSRDGTEEEYITEAGLEFHHPSTMTYLSGLGLDGTTS